MRGEADFGDLKICCAERCTSRLSSCWIEPADAPVGTVRSFVEEPLSDSELPPHGVASRKTKLHSACGDPYWSVLHLFNRTSVLKLKIELVGEIRHCVAHSEQDAASGLPLRVPFGVRELVIGNRTKPMRLIDERPSVSEILNLTETLDS